jgi:hypothetical protein
MTIRFDVLTSAIGPQKVAMTCWPFKNLTVDQFLEKCTIPYRIFWHQTPLQNTEWCVERRDYVITKKTSTKYEKAFVVFNPDSPTNEKEFIILQYINDVKKVDDVISFNSLK